MLRTMVGAMLITLSAATLGQELGVLHVTIVLRDAQGGRVPVPNHALLISDNPTSAPPRRIVTGAAGTADVKLRPGNYTVESDRPVAFSGKAYQWTQTLNIASGRDAVLELTVDNADVEAVAPGSVVEVNRTSPLEVDPALLLPKWHESVVAVWTPTTRMSGFVINATGLIATGQRGIGTATSVEVQFTRQLKVTATVVAADRDRDVAVLWVHPDVTVQVPPVPLACGRADTSPIAIGQKVFTLGRPLAEKDVTSGTVTAVKPHSVEADFESDISRGGAGAPVFTADGTLVGLTSLGDGKDHQRRREETRVVLANEACGVVAAAERNVAGGAPPSGRHLPVEPEWTRPVDALKVAAEHRVGSLSPYKASSSAFDVNFVTPVMTYGMQHQPDRRGVGGSRTTPAPPLTPPMDFGDWSDYVADVPPVLLVRVTPKQAESFWTTVARGAARVQGVSLPAMKHFTGSLSRLRAYCGVAEVVPIHPFKIERRVSENEAMSEGLYVFDPTAFGPGCSSVKLTLFSEKEPQKEDTLVVDPRVVQQIWQDFALYPAANR